MRITKLSIEKYKNLENFSWELNPDYPVAVIVGKNGSGKTNLLEALITIFQDLQLYSEDRRNSSLPDFEFELTYLHGENNDEIVIKNEEKLEISKNGENVPLSRLKTFRQDVSRGEEILPKTIFVYYAGNTTRLADLSNKSISEYKQTLINIATNKIEMQSSPKQPLFYYDLIHHRIVFLTLLLSTNENIGKRFLNDDLKITNLDAVHLTISRPEWQKGTDTETFWNAPNFSRRILAIIRETASLEENLKKSSEINFEIAGEDLQKKFAESDNEISKEDNYLEKIGEQDFFQQLSNLVSAGYLSEIKIFFGKSDVSQTLEFADLSEGEWQRIGIRGAMELFQGEETLFLLDEPDTFAHPRWQWEFVPDIKKTVGENNKSLQAIFITHSPLVLSSLKDNVFMMEKGKNIEPITEAYGEALDIVLTKMDGDSIKVEKDFENYFRLIEEGKAETDEAKAERKRLEEKYGVSHSEIARAEMWISFYK